MEQKKKIKVMDSEKNRPLFTGNGIIDASVSELEKVAEASQAIFEKVLHIVKKT